jgi:uncharacterized protein
VPSRLTRERRRRPNSAALWMTARVARGQSMPHEFLSAEWRYLAMLNYRVPAEWLTPFVPVGTELDLWDGAAYLSLVGFHFRNTRLLGVPIPFHQTFEEVNLRFYVRRTVNGEVRRGVTFLRELVPMAAIAFVARLSFNEPYRTLSMRHRIDAEFPNQTPSLVEYEWRGPSAWNRVRVEPIGASLPLEPGSQEEFITQHFWGYTRQRDGSAVEYEVRHPSWRIWKLRVADLDDDSTVFDAPFAGALRRAPHSAFLADGSAVSLYFPTRLDAGGV